MKPIAVSQAGMTLIEVMVATAILAVISVYTAETVQRAVRSKAKVEKDMERLTTVRDALRIIERDVTMAFHYRDIHIELYNLAEKERLARKKKTGGAAGGTAADKKTPAPNTGTPPGAEPPPAEGSPTGAPDSNEANFKPKKQKLLTQFLGEENRMDFATLSYTRIRDDDRASDQAEVGYFLRDCKDRFDKKKSSHCLWRRVDPVLDDDVTKGGTETVLLENVQRFELRYLGPGKETEWVKRWKTNSGGDANSENKFPYAVEITLEYHDKTNPKEKPMSMTTVASIRFPNNPDKDDPSVNNKGLGGQSETTPSSPTN